MNLQFLSLISVFSSAIAFSNAKFAPSQLKKASPDWSEAIGDFKVLVHAITFGEEIPSHHTYPLQMLAKRRVNSQLAKNPFDLPGEWFGGKKGIKSNGGNSRMPVKKSKKSSKSKKNHKSSKAKKSNAINLQQLHKQQSLDDLALLNFLVQLEEPNTRASAQTHKTKKHLSSLIMAENRYNEIKKRISATQTKAQRTSLLSKSSKLEMKNKKGPSKPFTSSKKDDAKSKKWYNRFDAKGAKSTLTLSVAFGVIVTALFCVVVQLFKLFANTKGGRNGGAFDQINRRSTHGYDRIALDVEEDEETATLNH